jgi:hypothetical protein
MYNWLLNLSDDNLLKLIGLIGASIAFFIALYRYTVSQKWKKSEFLVSEYRSFINNDFVQKAFLLLDDFKMNLKYIDSAGSDKILLYNSANILNALKNSHENPNKNRKYSNDPGLEYVRLCIDKFLFKMGVFQNHLDSNLIEKKKLEPYLKYWLELIGNINDSGLPSALRQEIHFYAQDNKLISLIKLFKSYGYILQTRVG